MQSFRTELEGAAGKNGKALVEKDIVELEKKIRLFREGKMNDEKFRSLRLARGVYGQRQEGVQMVRIKLHYGKMTLAQWKRIADVSDEYSTGNLHLTTRQDIQIHFVSLDRTPQLWAELERDDITLREACGNTVRNITASPMAGIDKDELFDVTPYAHAMFEYFLRNPICQEMGRKIKIAFSSSEADTALTFMHDFGFIPKIITVDGKEVRGFKVLVGGGLGNQATLAYGTVPGGYLNLASATLSFAAGRQAKAMHQGSFVWGDSTAADIASTATNQFIVRATGGIWLGKTSTPSMPAGRFLNTSTGAYLSTGGAWTNNSDRALKTNIAAVDARAVREGAPHRCRRPVAFPLPKDFAHRGCAADRLQGGFQGAGAQCVDRLHADRHDRVRSGARGTAGRDVRPQLLQHAADRALLRRSAEATGAHRHAGPWIPAARRFRGTHDRGARASEVVRLRWGGPRLERTAWPSCSRARAGTWCPLRPR